MAGKSVCYNHGGRTPVGIASPQTKTGRYSKHLPTRMLATYEAAKVDPELLSLREEVALLDARLVDLLKRVDTGESGASWRALSDAYAKFRAAQVKKDAAEMGVHMAAIGSIITDGLADEAAWSEIRAVVNQRRSVSESERKRLVEMQQMVSGDQAMLMVRSLVASVREHVHDPAILRAISDDLSRLTLARAD